MECLVKQLKSEVLDNNLPIFGTIRFSLTGTGTSVACLSIKTTDNNTKIKVVSGDGNIYMQNTLIGKEANVSQLIKYGDDYLIYMESGVTCEMTIDRAYMITEIKGHKVDNILSMKLEELDDKLNFKSLFAFNGSAISGDYSSCSLLKDLETLDIYGSATSGNIESFSNCNKLKRLILSRVSGNFDLFLSSIAGKRTDTLIFGYDSGSLVSQTPLNRATEYLITFNGQGGYSIEKNNQ